MAAIAGKLAEIFKELGLLMVAHGAVSRGVKVISGGKSLTQSLVCAVFRHLIIINCIVFSSFFFSIFSRQQLFLFSLRHLLPVCAVMPISNIRHHPHT